MVHQRVNPGEQQMRLVAEIALQRLAGFGFVRFEALAARGDLACRQP